MIPRFAGSADWQWGSFHTITITVMIMIMIIMLLWWWWPASFNGFSLTRKGGGRSSDTPPPLRPPPPLLVNCRSLFVNVNVNRHALLPSNQFFSGKGSHSDVTGGGEGVEGLNQSQFISFPTAG